VIEKFGGLDERPRYMFYTGTSKTEPYKQNSDEQYFQKFLIDSGEGKSNDNRDILLKNFNSVYNSSGQRVQVIIINSAAEGITIKNVRYVHLLHLPSNMSKIFQIIGRAIRNCTHQALAESERTVTPILYLGKYDEYKYENMIAVNRGNIPFLNILKETTIDCLLNQKKPTQKCYITEDNMYSFPSEVWVGFDILAPSDNREAYIRYASNKGILTNQTTEAQSDINQNEGQSSGFEIEIEIKTDDKQSTPTFGGKLRLTRKNIALKRKYKTRRHNKNNVKNL